MDYSKSKLLPALSRLTPVVAGFSLACASEQPQPIEGLWEHNTLTLYSAYAFEGDTWERRTVQPFPYLETAEDGLIKDLDIELTHGGTASSIDGLAHVPSLFGFEYTMDQLTRFDAPAETGRIAFRTAPDNLTTMIAVTDPFPVLALSDGTDSVEIALESNHLPGESYATTWSFNGVSGAGSVTLIDAGKATFSGCTPDTCIVGYFRYGG